MVARNQLLRYKQNAVTRQSHTFMRCRPHGVLATKGFPTHRSLKS